MKRYKRLLSGLLVFVMLLSLLPVSAYASFADSLAETDISSTTTPSEDGNQTPANSEETTDNGDTQDTTQGDPVEEPKDQNTDHPGEEVTDDGDREEDGSSQVIPPEDESKEGDPNQISDQETTPPPAANGTDNPDGTDQEKKEEQETKPSDLGEFKLIIKHIIPDYDSNFKALLRSESNKEYEVKMTRENESDLTTGLVSGLPEGTYNLVVTGNFYLTYRQPIEIKNECVTIELYNDDKVNDNRDKDKKFGVITLGDFNEDGKIDDDDSTLVKDAIGKENLIYDVDENKAINLIDLAYIARNGNGNTNAKSLRTVSSLAMKEATTTLENTTAKDPAGNQIDAEKITEEILSHDTESYVTLAPAGNGKISETNPVQLDLNLTSAENTQSAVEAEAITIAPPTNSKNLITAGTVEVTANDGTIYTATIKSTHMETTQEESTQGENNASNYSINNNLIRYGSPAQDEAKKEKEAKEVTVEKDGTVVINIGAKVAIKKVSIRVTETSGEDLAQIASVQFLGDFADRIPEPDLAIPTIEDAWNTEGEYKDLTFTWTAQNNVTGYEVLIVGPGLNVQRSVTQTDGNKYTFQSDSFNGKINAFATYDLQVRSVNGNWRSAWSPKKSYTITCKALPQKPEYVAAAGDIMSINVTWRELWDTQYWTVHYRLQGSSDPYQEITANKPSCRIENLEAGKSYEIYVVAHNVNGKSADSVKVTAMALTAEGTRLPKYQLLNLDNDRRISMDHIKSITGNKNQSYVIMKDGVSVSNANATEEDWKAIADSNPASYLVIDDWDSGISYANFRGPKIQLDGTYTIGAIRIAPCETAKYQMSNIVIGYKNGDGQLVKVPTSFRVRYDDQHRRYYEAIPKRPIETDYLEVYTTNSYGAAREITIAEIGIYEDNPLLAEVRGLFTDEQEVELKPNVTLEKIAELKAKAEIPDEYDELNPSKDIIDTLLDYAEKLLKDEVQDDPVTVNNKITAKVDGHLGFAQTLSDNQPLGYVAAAGDTVILYVGSKTESNGANSNLHFVVTQYHPEVSKWCEDKGTLKVGRNEITIPKLISTDGKERGGSLYVYYDGNKGEKEYTIRVKGAQRIPMLDVDGVADRTSAIDKYVTELETYDPKALHASLHLNNKNENVNFEYKPEECFLNSTEIVMKNMIFSFPATQVLAGISSENDNHKMRVDKLTAAIEAMEQEVKLFYQFKGLNENATDSDRYPMTRLNIRYHQMFTGAFMYAGGKHIGIEWDSVPGLFHTSPVTTDANGKKTNGNYSGWGIAHEIGHCINSAAYQRVEVTNNVFAQLAQTNEANDSFRTSYDKVYKAVAAGNTGHTGDLAVQLAMYWQLHLAYDNDYSYKFYDDVATQQASLFYARVDSYFRNTAKADKVAEQYPKDADRKTEKPLKLNLGTNADQNFMRVCCVAAEHDILDFFRAWGFTPDAETIAYASIFPKEERDIQFIDDNSRLYRIEGKPRMSTETAVIASITNQDESRINDNEVNITLNNTNQVEGAMLGYEIFRNGKLVAFVEADKTSYTDIVATENNKAFVYSIVGVDHLLNETEELFLDEVKVQHKGAIDKSDWTAETNMTSSQDTPIIANGNNGYCHDSVESAIGLAFDNNTETVYDGTVTPAEGESSDAQITLNLGGLEQITALEYVGGTTHAIGAYKIEVSTDNENWQLVKEDNKMDQSEPIYFNKIQDDGTLDPYMYIYEASFVRITATGQSSISVAELDILGPTSDNIELESEGFGRMANDYHFSEGEDNYIPANSIVFYGTFKGDPSYNVVVLRDQNGKIINGDQVILAPVADKGYLGNTSDGGFFYWLENDEALTGVTSVQAELYRVDNALTLEGGRVTSTTLHLEIPENLANLNPVTITSNPWKGEAANI